MAERKRDTKRTSKTATPASRSGARPARAPERKGAASKAAARPAPKAAAKAPVAKAPVAKTVAKTVAKSPAKREPRRTVIEPPLTPSPVEELSIPSLSPGEWYQQEKRRREAEGPTAADPLAEAKREYLAMLAAEAEKGKGGRPRGSGANKGKPPARPVMDDD